MELQQLTAISPIDGRYRQQLEQLAPYFSEYALIRYRIHVEVEYFIFLANKKLFPLPAAKARALRQLAASFTTEQAAEIKNLERVTNHDVKAVEYFLKRELEQLGLADLKEWVHFGLTSQDINNTSIPLAWKDALEQELLPALGLSLIHI